MSKILKNNSGSNVTILDTGVTIANNSQYTINPQDYLLWASSSDVITHIGNGNLVVNDGSFDLTISDGVSLIKGSYPTSVQIQPNLANRSAFNDSLSESVQPITQISGNYGTADARIEIFEATGGTADVVDNMFRCQTGTSLGGYSVVRTRKPTLYREGQGLMWRGTAIFSTGVANSLQFAGLFNLNDTVAFGYRGTNFGIIYENYGSPEIRSLKVTSSGNGNLTLTLNSVSYVIPITTGTVNHNAYEICHWLNQNQSIWKCEQISDTVIFQAQDTSARSGTYSISGTSLAGTFTQLRVGATKNNNDILRTGWDNNPEWFDPTVSNLYMIKVSYLGFGPIRFFIMNTTTCEWELVHTIKPLGIVTKPSISSRALKAGWVAASLGSTTNVIVKGASSGTFIEGDSKLFAETNSHQATNSFVGSTYESIVTVRANRVFNNNTNLGRLVLSYVNIANDSTKPVEYIFVKNTNLGETNFINHSSDSIVSYDETVHNYTSGGHIVFSGVMSSSSSVTVPLENLNIEMQAGDYFTVFARKRSGTDIEVNVSITWKEDL